MGVAAGHVVESPAPPLALPSRGDGWFCAPPAAASSNGRPRANGLFTSPAAPPTPPPPGPRVRRLALAAANPGPRRPSRRARGEGGGACVRRPSLKKKKSCKGGREKNIHPSPPKCLPALLIGRPRGSRAHRLVGRAAAQSAAAGLSVYVYFFFLSHSSYTHARSCSSLRLASVPLCETMIGRRPSPSFRASCLSKTHIQTSTTLHSPAPNY